MGKPGALAEGGTEETIPRCLWQDAGRRKPESGTGFHGVRCEGF